MLSPREIRPRRIAQIAPVKMPEPRRTTPIEPMKLPEPAWLGWLRAAADVAAMGGVVLLIICFLTGWL